MAASAAAINGTNEHNAEVIARRVGGILTVHGIQSRTVGDELAWGRTPAEVSSIFYSQRFNFALFNLCIYLFISI
jgi:hypothetical protein